MDSLKSSNVRGAAIATAPAEVDWNALAAQTQGVRYYCEPHNVEVPRNLQSFYNYHNLDGPMIPNAVLEQTMTYFPPRLPKEWSMAESDFQRPAVEGPRDLSFPGGPFF
jgi:hypothetical protein